MRSISMLMAGLCVPNLAYGACSVSVTPLVEVYNPASGTALVRSSTVTVSCTLLSGLGGYSVAASAGAGTYGNRVMSKSGSTLRYQLYLDAGLTTVWGDGTGGTSVVSGSSLVPVLGGSFSFTVWSESLPGLPVSPGTFTDSVTVTLQY